MWTLADKQLTSRLLMGSALYPSPALRATAVLKDELDGRGLNRRNVGLVLPDNAFQLHLSAARAPKRTR